MSGPTICYPPPEWVAPTIQLYQSARPRKHLTTRKVPRRARADDLDEKQNAFAFTVFKQRRWITVELTRRRSTTLQTSYRKRQADSARVQRFVISRPSGSRRPFNADAERATKLDDSTTHSYSSRAMTATWTTYQHGPFAVLKKRRGITVELTRRRSTTLRTSCR